MRKKKKVSCLYIPWLKMRSHAAHEERWCCTCWRWIVYEFLASLDLCWHLSPLFWLQQAAGSRQAAGKQQASSKQVSSRSKKGICKLFLFLVVGMQCCDRAFAALQCRENFSVCLFLLSYYCASLSFYLFLFVRILPGQQQAADSSRQATGIRQV